MAKMFAKIKHKRTKLDKCSGCVETMIYGAMWKKLHPSYRVSLVIKNNFHLKLEVAAPSKPLVKGQLK